MTASHLLAFIVAALAVQLAVGVRLSLRQLRLAQAVSGAALPAAPAEVAGAWPGWRRFRVVRRTFEDRVRSQCSFELAPVDGVALPAFLPGQYLTLSLPVVAPEGGGARSVTRCYSLSDRPEPDAYRITVKRAAPPPAHPAWPPGVASSHLLDRVHEADVLDVRAPAGRFVIDAEVDVPVVFVAGGIGITPMLSMLRWCVVRQPERVVHLFYGVRCGDDHAFKAALEALALAHRPMRLHVVYSQPAAVDVLGRDYQHAGRIDLALLRAVLPEGRHRFYVCGPPPMMAGVTSGLRAWGVRDDDIRVEAFGPAAERPVAPVTNEPSTATAASIDVRFSRAGRTLVWDGRDANLLDFAERQGIPIESGCRTGSCGTCETRVVSGDVVHAGTPDFATRTGYCLPCVGTPRSELVLDA